MLQRYLHHEARHTVLLSVAAHTISMSADTVSSTVTEPGTERMRQSLPDKATMHARRSCKLIILFHFERPGEATKAHQTSVNALLLAHLEGPNQGQLDSLLACCNEAAICGRLLCTEDQ